MNTQKTKIQRSFYLIKGFMVLVVIMQVVQFYQVRVIDFGEVAGAVGFLSFLRGLLLSPLLLAAPIKQGFKANSIITKESYTYFIFAFILTVVSIF